MSTYTDALRKAKQQRVLAVRRMRDGGMTFEQIGGKLGVTRQRAHQLYRESQR